MTDEPPTDYPGDVWVTGQRRAPGGSFPKVSGDDSGVHQDEVDPDGGSPDGPQMNPCLDPATALEWNADAAAAEAKREFERQAAERGDDGLYSREWHAFLYQDATGRVYVGPVVAGSQGTVTPDTSGMTPDNLIGFIHNHPGGGLNPSGDDWAGFDSLYNWVAQWSSGGQARANQLRQYIIARDTTDPNSSMAIRVFNNDSSRSSDAPAPEVNPEAQQCP
jgi:hypothetical protein